MNLKNFFSTTLLKIKFPWRICNILTFNIHGVYKQPFVEWNGSNTMLKVLDATINAIKETLFIQVYVTSDVNWLQKMPQNNKVVNVFFE